MIMSSFSRVYTLYRGGRRSRVTVHFFNVVFRALRFGGVSKSIFSKYSFDGEGGGHKKSTLCTFLIMFPTLDDPLEHTTNEYVGNKIGNHSLPSPNDGRQGLDTARQPIQGIINGFCRRGRPHKSWTDVIEWTNMVMPDILVKAIWRKTSGLSPPRLQSPRPQSPPPGNYSSQ